MWKTPITQQGEKRVYFGNTKFTKYTKKENRNIPQKGGEKIILKVQTLQICNIQIQKKKGKRHLSTTAGSDNSEKYLGDKKLARNTQRDLPFGNAKYKKQFKNAKQYKYRVQSFL